MVGTFSVEGRAGYRAASGEACGYVGSSTYGMFAVELYSSPIVSGRRRDFFSVEVGGVGRLFHGYAGFGLLRFGGIARFFTQCTRRVIIVSLVRSGFQARFVSYPFFGFFWSV